MAPGFSDALNYKTGGVPATLRLTDTRTLDSGVVTLTYVPTAPGAP